MTDETDDDYQQELYLDRKRREGWRLCPYCEQWLHVEDEKEGATCACEEDETH